jgi:hypothetical protein
MPKEHQEMCLDLMKLSLHHQGKLRERVLRREQRNDRRNPGVEATPPARRRPRASTGGFSLKLDAEQRPGFVRRFVNGDPTAS